MAQYGYGTPISIGDPTKVWGGTDRTNGFLMRNVDGRIPSLEESFANILADPSSPLIEENVLPWGHGLFIDIANVDSSPHTLSIQKPAKGVLQGVFKFEQGWATGNPVQNFGIPLYSRGTVIRKGFVGYKFALASGGDPDDYVKYIRGDSSKDVGTVRTVYSDWVTTWKAGADGSRLGLFIDNDTGFPTVALIPAAQLSAPVLSGATFAGLASVFESENQAVFFHINL